MFGLIFTLMLMDVNVLSASTQDDPPFMAAIVGYLRLSENKRHRGPIHCVSIMLLLCWILVTIKLGYLASYFCDPII